MPAGATESSRDKVRSHRARMRARGMKLVQFRVPDTDAPAFKAEAQRQSHIIGRSPHEAADQGFIDAISEF